MARDWRATLRPASFRGVGFWVEEDSTDGVGRRVAVHEISGGEANPTEDMGVLVRTASVSAYVAGDVADSTGLTLEAACAAAGPALLTLPIDPARAMHCIGCRRNRHRDRAGYIAYDLEFLLAGSGAGATGPGGIGALRGLLEETIGAVSAALARARA